MWQGNLNQIDDKINAYSFFLLSFYLKFPYYSLSSSHVTIFIISFFASVQNFIVNTKYFKPIIQNIYIKGSFVKKKVDIFIFDIWVSLVYKIQLEINK